MNKQEVLVDVLKKLKEAQNELAELRAADIETHIETYSVANKICEAIAELTLKML